MDINRAVNFIHSKSVSSDIVILVCAFNLQEYLVLHDTCSLPYLIGLMTGNASCGKTTYVHCKAGRGRSTTIVLCYLVHFFPFIRESSVS